MFLLFPSISESNVQQVALCLEKPLHDGNAHSARGEMIHDGLGKLEKLNHQEETDSETFVMGSDAAEFCGQRPSAKHAEKNVERCRVR